jgi:hypothetical protein
LRLTEKGTFSMKKYAHLLAASALMAAGSFAMIAPANAQPRGDFAIQLGNVGIAYYDGYYDHDRRWHRWDSNAQRNWYRLNHRNCYFHIRRDRDRDRDRRAWWQGRRSGWRCIGGGPDFAIVLGNVVFAYEDGYYDRDRRWHYWQSDAHRDWYRRNYAQTYFTFRRDTDRDRYRRDWWEGRRSDWRFYGDRDDRGGVDFSIMLGNVVFAYEDGYYDRDRRWHTWQSDAHRDWYRRNHARTYHSFRRDRDDDRMRRDWWEGRRDDWDDDDRD